uniref:hypothetical protein n=1 Tax=Providencia heimbachae TaxID=333962 RepID=UPI0022409FC4
LLNRASKLTSAKKPTHTWEVSMFIVYTIIVIAFFISLATIDIPDSEFISVDIEDKRIGLMYVM